MIFGAGPQVQACLNVKALVENNLLYADNSECGHEDIDLAARCIESGFQITKFSWLIYHADAVGTLDSGTFSSSGNSQEKLLTAKEHLIERFKDSQEKLKARHGDFPWIVFEEKRGLPQVSLKPMRIRKWQKEKGFYGNYDDYKFDIWKDGELLNEAKTGYSKEI